MALATQGVAMAMERKSADQFHVFGEPGLTPEMCAEHDFRIRSHGVRVWIDEEKDAEARHYDNSLLESGIRSRELLSQRDLAKWIAEQPRVNAVHVRSLSTGRGRVIYVNWP